MKNSDRIGERGGYVVSACTMRDFFAGVVIAGLLAGGTRTSSYREIAEKAYKAADALLDARQLPSKEG